MIGACGGLLDHRQRTDELRKVGKVDARDWKILNCTQGLNAVTRIEGQIAFAE